MPPFITQDSWLFNNASTQETKFLPKPNFFKTVRMNLWSSESNAFSMSIVTKNPPILLRSHILTISDINLPPSPINLFLIYAVCCVEIKLERTFFNLSEWAFEIILVSIFNKEMDRQFLMYLLSLSFFFFPIIFLFIACLYEMLNSPLCFASVAETISNSLISSQKPS